MTPQKNTYQELLYIPLFVVVILANAFYYTLLHESSHALMAYLLGSKNIYLELGFFSGATYYTPPLTLTSAGDILILLAGSLGGALFSYLTYVAIFFLWSSRETTLSKKKRLSMSLKRPFLGFSTIKKQKKRYSEIAFFLLLFLVVIGYYLHWNRLIYALFPDIDIFPYPSSMVSGQSDGYQVWKAIFDYDVAASTIKQAYWLGFIINIAGLCYILFKAHDAYSPCKKEETASTDH